MTKFHPIRSLCAVLVLVLAGGADHYAQALTTDTRVADAPFDDPARFSQSLPDLGSTASDDSALEKRVAQAMKTIGEASMSSDDDQSLGSEAGQWAFNHFRDEAAKRAETEGQQLLSPYGRASMSLMVDMKGDFSGTSAQLVTPWADNYQIRP